MSDLEKHINKHDIFQNGSTLVLDSFTRLRVSLFPELTYLLHNLSFLATIAKSACKFAHNNIILN